MSVCKGAPAGAAATPPPNPTPPSNLTQRPPPALPNRRARQEPAREQAGQDARAPGGGQPHARGAPAPPRAGHPHRRAAPVCVEHRHPARPHRRQGVGGWGPGCRAGGLGGCCARRVQHGAPAGGARACWRAARLQAVPPRHATQLNAPPPCLPLSSASPPCPQSTSSKHHSVPDLVLEGHTEDAEFAVAVSSAAPRVASGGKDTQVGLLFGVLGVCCGRAEVACMPAVLLASVLEGCTSACTCTMHAAAARLHCTPPAAAAAAAPSPADDDHPFCYTL